jgi:hypothetical protein
MKQSRIAYYTDFAVYPVLVAVMTVVITGTASAAELAVALAVALVGVLLWGLLEYRLHRFVPHIHQ